MEATASAEAGFTAISIDLGLLASLGNLARSSVTLIGERLPVFFLLGAGTSCSSWSGEAQPFPR
jgi:hypothetical protein